MKLFPFILLFSINVFSQSTVLRPFETEKDYSITYTVIHNVIGKVKKVAIKTYTYDNQNREFKENFDVFPDFYRPGIFHFDDSGRVEKRIIFRGDKDTKKLESYSYKSHGENDFEQLVTRYWKSYSGDIPNTQEIDFSLKEYYQNGLLIKRFVYQYVFEYNYDTNGNLLKIIRKEYEKAHQYDENDILLNKAANKIKGTTNLFSFKYDSNNRCIEKKEINSEYITYITTYVYSDEELVLKEIKGSYTDNVLSYLTVSIFNYDEKNNLSERRNYTKHASSESQHQDDEVFISSFLTFIEKNPGSYLDEHSSYTYTYDNVGNWLVKTFREWGAEVSSTDDSQKSNWKNNYKIERVITYY